ncbi:MAG TPA: dipeptidase [Croceibacterium sp.]|nr:dipeptidase [Croceibacterium sp.]
MMRLILPLVALMLASPLAAKKPEEVAAAALKAAPIWDGHNDVGEQLRERRRDVIAGFDFNDTTHEPEGKGGTSAMQTDLPRLAKGHIGAEFWSVYVSADQPEPQAAVATVEQIDVMKRLIARYPDRLQLALTSADVERAIKAGKIASLLGMEGGHSIDGSLGVLRQMYALGARYMTLAHFKNNAWADSATDDPKHDGLTDFGKDVVREMQRLGMLVDLAHVSEATMNDALDVAKAPLIFSHSGARAVDGASRNVPDAVLERVKANGGIVMAVAYPSYVNEALRDWEADDAAEQAREKVLFAGQPEKAKAAVTAWEAAHPAPKATVQQVADHIDHLRAVAGIDHIGLGGDFDGMATGPVGMEDVSGYPALFVELARRGYSQQDLEKISSRNMMRVLKAAEAYSAAHSNDPPIEYPVAEIG